MKPDYTITSGGLPVRFVRGAANELLLYVPDAVESDAFDGRYEEVYAQAPVHIEAGRRYLLAEPRPDSADSPVNADNKARWRVVSLIGNEAPHGLGYHVELHVTQFWGSVVARFNQRFASLLSALAMEVNAALDELPDLSAVVSMASQWQPTTTMTNLVRTIWIGTLNNIEEWVREGPDSEEQVSWRASLKPDGDPVDPLAPVSPDGPMSLAHRVANLVNEALRQQGVPSGDWSYHGWMAIIQSNDGENI